MLFNSLALDSVSSVPSQEIGWEEHRQYDLIYVEWYMKS